MGFDKGADAMGTNDDDDDDTGDPDVLDEDNEGGATLSAKTVPNCAVGHQSSTRTASASNRDITSDATDEAVDNADWASAAAGGGASTAAVGPHETRQR